MNVWKALLRGAVKETVRVDAVAQRGRCPAERRVGGGEEAVTCSQGGRVEVGLLREAGEARESEGSAGMGVWERGEGREDRSLEEEGDGSGKMGTGLDPGQEGEDGPPGQVDVALGAVDATYVDDGVIYLFNWSAWVQTRLAATETHGGKVLDDLMAR